MEDPQILKIGPILKSWMEIRGLTVGKLASKATIETSSINSMIRHHQNTLRSDRLIRVAEALNITPEVLMLYLSPVDLMTPDVPNAAKLMDTPGGIELLLAIHFIKAMREKNPEILAL